MNTTITNEDVCAINSKSIDEIECLRAENAELRRDAEQARRIIQNNFPHQTLPECKLAGLVDQALTFKQSRIFDLEKAIKKDNAVMLAALMHLRENKIEFGSKELIARLDEIDQLRSQISKATKDKERLDWLEDNESNMLTGYVGKHKEGGDWECQLRVLKAPWHLQVNSNVRQAIDAAIEAQKGANE